MAASKWDFLPEALREGLDGRNGGVSLDDGTLQDVVSRAAMPANMLAILFQKLSTDPRVPTDARRGLEYLLYFIEGKKDGVGKDAQKMDFLTFFLSVSDGLKNWPVEVARSLQALASQHAMYEVCKSDSTDICMLQLGSVQHPDGVIRKMVDCSSLKSCLDKCGSSISAAAPKGSSLVSNRALAVLPLSEWGGAHWNFAQKRQMFASTETKALMAKEFYDASTITPELHATLAGLLKTNESIRLMDDEDQGKYYASIDGAELTLIMTDLRERLLEIDFDIDELLDIVQPTPYANYKKSWGLVKWDKLVVYFFTIIQKTRSVDIFDLSNYGGVASSSNPRAQDVATKNLQALEQRWALSQGTIQSEQWSGVQTALARHCFKKSEPHMSLLGCRSLEDTALNDVYYDLYKEATGHNDMSEVNDIFAIAWSTGTRLYMRGLAIEWYILEILDQVLLLADTIRTGFIDTLKLKLIAILKGGDSKVVFGPLTLASGINSVLGLLLQTLVSIDSLPMTSETRRQALIDFYDMKLRWVCQVGHSSMPQSTIMIPSSSAVSRLYQYQDTLAAVGTSLTLVDYFKALTKTEPCLMAVAGPAPFHSLSLVIDDYQHVLMSFFSQDMLDSRVGCKAENKSLGLHVAYAHLCELLAKDKSTNPLVREFFDCFAIIENDVKKIHYTVPVEPVPAQPPLQQGQAAIQSAMSVHTGSPAVKHLTPKVLERIKLALDTNEQVCTLDLLGSPCNGSCNITHGSISWQLGRAVSLFLREKLDDKDFVIGDLSQRNQKHKTANTSSVYVKEAEVIAKLTAAGIPFMAFSKGLKGGKKGQQLKPGKESAKKPSAKPRRGRDEPYCLIKAESRDFHLTKGPVKKLFETWAGEVEQLLSGKGEFEVQSHCPLMLKGQPRPVCARKDLKGFQYNSCGAEPCVIAQLLRNPRAKEWIIEVFKQKKFDATAVYDLLVKNMSAAGIIDHVQLLGHDLTPFLLSKASSASTLLTKGPAAEPPVGEDMHAQIALLQGQVAELMSNGSGGSVSGYDDGSVVGSGGSMSGWDTASVGSSVASGMSRSDGGGGGQRVAAAGVSRVLPPARVFGAATGDGMQLMNVNPYEYQQFMAFKAAQSLGKGRGRGGYGGRLPPIQHTNPNQK